MFDKRTTPWNGLLPYLGGPLNIEDLWSSPRVPSKTHFSHLPHTFTQCSVSICEDVHSHILITAYVTAYTITVLFYRASQALRMVYERALKRKSAAKEATPPSLKSNGKNMGRKNLS
ncbi:hypothetical protein DNTS_023778 [Danionella cerebrum]|uniref:Uncharacterized protein n=1 Tax=Danionella cerebrum TaxID=2873325 RepID=A0A553QV99_9TELE|nr:hypothetical protein DNTS_023778 [Danionella translucida]TRY93867.1 hypothetical protein DNTS_023778 [Danionella translucida]